MDRDNRVHASDDLCVIMPAQDDLNDNDIYCIRVILEIPIKGAIAPFTWGVWVTQSKENFVKYVETYDQDQSSLDSFGWMPINMPFYNRFDEGRAIEHHECDIQWGTKGQRPKAYLWESSHPLSLDQRKGISWRKAMKIANASKLAFSRSDVIV